MHNLQVLQRPDPFPAFTPDPHCPDRLARTALAVDLPRRWRGIPADRSNFARSGLPMAVNQREQHTALQTTQQRLGGAKYTSGAEFRFFIAVWGNLDHSCPDTLRGDTQDDDDRSGKLVLFG